MKFTIKYKGEEYLLNDIYNLNDLKEKIKEILKIPLKKQIIYYNNLEIIDLPISQEENENIILKLVKKNKSQNKCNHTECNEKISIIGDCKWCSHKYCNQHRLPETHCCTNFNDCKKASFNKNADLLNGSKCNVKKIETI